MKELYIKEKTFKGLGFPGKEIQVADYEACTFRNCDFSEGDLSQMDFVDCLFVECNLSLTRLNGTLFQESEFKSCKMLGMPFENCNEFGLSAVFDHCLLDNSSFVKVTMPGVRFDTCHLHYVDFSEADLSMANFSESDLLGAVMNRTSLEKADFRAAVNFTIDPERNRLKGAVFSVGNLSGLLDKYGLDIR